MIRLVGDGAQRAAHPVDPRDPVDLVERVDEDADRGELLVELGQRRFLGEDREVVLGLVELLHGRPDLAEHDGGLELLVANALGVLPQFAQGEERQPDGDEHQGDDPPDPHGEACTQHHGCTLPTLRGGRTRPPSG